MKVVYAIFDDDKKDKSYWQRIGVAFDNKDGSVNVLLNCIPLNGRLHIREQDDKHGDDNAASGNEAPPPDDNDVPNDNENTGSGNRRGRSTRR